MESGIIYKATNTITGKCYIGQTIEGLEKRKYRHLINSFNINDGHYNCHFHRAIRKYGKNAWEWKVVLECPQEDLNIQEIITIEAIDSFYNGYNMTIGGEAPMRGKHHTEETKLKLSEATKGRVAWNKGKHLTEEHKNKLKKIKSEETKQKMSIAKIGNQNARKS